MKVGDWVRFNYSGLVGMVTHVDEHDCTVQLNGGYRKVLSRGEVQVIEPARRALSAPVRTGCRHWRIHWQIRGAQGVGGAQSRIRSPRYSP